MESTKINETVYGSLIETCPWCLGKCQYIESHRNSSGVVYRVGVSCDESLNADEDHGDSVVGDWGRSNWYLSIRQACTEWNATKNEGDKSGQLGVW
jgi:hypothetical protein